MMMVRHRARGLSFVRNSVRGSGPGADLDPRPDPLSTNITRGIHATLLVVDTYGGHRQGGILYALFDFQAQHKSVTRCIRNKSQVKIELPADYISPPYVMHLTSMWKEI